MTVLRGCPCPQLITKKPSVSLRNRFGNQQLIISRHMDANELECSDRRPRFKEAMMATKQYWNECLWPICSWCEPRLPRDNAHFCATTKPPSEMKFIVRRRLPREELALEAVQEILEDELSAQEQSAKTHQSRQVRHSHYGSRHVSSATTLASSTSATDRRPQKCCYCTSGRCFNCLGKRHIVQKYRSHPQCQTCKHKHHPWICEAESANISPPANPTPLNTNLAVSTLSPEAHLFVTTTDVSAL